jgi:hypothetical protein
MRIRKVRLARLIVNATCLTFMGVSSTKHPPLPHAAGADFTIEAITW